MHPAGVHVRRGYLFLGEVPIIGPVGIPTNKGSSAGSGDWVAIGGDPNAYWPTIQAEYIGVIGCQAFIWNHIGTGTKAAPVPALQLFQGSILALQENGCTDPNSGGEYPSSYNGPEYSFLLQAMGDPGRYLFNGSSLSPTFLLNGGGSLGTMASAEQVCGAIAAISGAGSTTITVTLTHAHGIPASTQDEVWIHGLDPLAGSTPDPQLTARHTATAHATDPLKFSITLPIAWNGQAGTLPAGVVTRARYRITSLSNPSGNTLRVRLSDGLPSWRSWGGNAQLWLGGTSGVTGIDGLYQHLQRAVAYVNATTSNTNVQAVAPGTLNLTSGTWTVQPLVGEVIQIAGGTNAGKRLRVTSSTTTQIVGTAVDGSTALVSAAAGTSITLTNYAIVDIAYGGAVPSLGGYVAGSGFAFVRSPWHPVFWPECGGKFDLPRTIDTWAQVEAGAAAYFASYPGGVFAGDTVAIDAVCLGNLGYSDADAVAGTARYQAMLSGWRQSMREIVQAVRARVAPLTSSGQAAENVKVVVANFGVDIEPHPSDPSLYKGGDRIQTTAVIQYQTRAGAADAGAAVVETLDLAHGVTSRVPSARGTWDLGERLWRAVRSLDSGAAPGTDRVANVVFLLGQSHAEGSINNLVTQPFQEAGDPDFDSSWYTPDLATVLVDRGIKKLNLATGAWEEYSPVKNANSYTPRFAAAWPGRLAAQSGSPGVGTVGPEASMVLELRQRFENVYLIKVANGGAALQDVHPGSLPTFAPASNDLAADILYAWELGRAQLEAAGLVPDIRAVVFDQGEADSAGDWPASYEAAQADFITWFRANIRTAGRSRPEIPFVLGLVQTHARLTFDLAGCNAINLAKQAVAASASRVVVASMQGLPKNSGNIHDTWEACIARGRRYDRALAPLISDDGFEVDGGASINPRLSPSTDEDWTGYTPTDEQVDTVGGAGSGGSAPTVGIAVAAEEGATAIGDPVELPADSLGRARAIIALIDQAVAEGLDLVSYSVNGRATQLRGLAELTATRSYYATIAARLGRLGRTIATF